jgi:peptidoglycan/xylan/chitin deacetylase (PgdA/CDA1 family)
MDNKCSTRIEILMHGTSKYLALSLLSLIGAFHAGRYWFRRRLVVLTYHRVLPEKCQEGGTRPLDSLFSWEFEWQIAHIARHYHVVTGEEVRAFLAGESCLPPYSVLITFDDGFENNYTEAFPILQRYGIHAAFFLTTGQIGQSKTALWFDRLDAVLSAAPWADVSLWLAHGGAPYDIQDARQLRLWLKRLSQPHRDQTITALERAAGVEGLGAQAEVTSKLLTWDQVRDMAAQGMTIGSHTASHQILASASPDEVRRELITSRQQIEAEIGRPCWCFSYPNGTAADFRLSDKAAVRSAGYACAFTQISGFVSPDTDRYALPRISMSESSDTRVFLSRLTGVHHMLQTVIAS